MLLAFAMLILPASAVLNLTLGHEFGVLVQAEQKRMNEQSHDAALMLKDEARMLLYSDHVGDEIVSAHELRQGQLLPVPADSRLRPSPFDATLAPVSFGDQHIIGVHDWLNESLPAESALLARLRYHEVPSRYTPQGSLGPLSWFGAIGITVIIVVLSVWIRWSARHLHAADVAEGEAVPDDQIETRWNDLPENDRYVLLQATEERIANPRQLPTIAALAQKGFLKLSPDIQPATSGVAAWLARLRADRAHAKKLRKWRPRTTATAGRRYVRSSWPAWGSWRSSLRSQSRRCSPK
jgi:hypothetical protein